MLYRLMLLATLLRFVAACHCSSDVGDADLRDAGECDSDFEPEDQQKDG